MDEWRVFRTQAWAVAVSSGNYKTQPKPEDLLPLPYDEEDKEVDNPEDLQSFYDNAIKELYGR